MVGWNSGVFISRAFVDSRVATAPVLNMDTLPVPDFDDFVEQSAALGMSFSL